MKQLNDALHKARVLDLHKARVLEEQIRVTKLLDYVLHYKTDVSRQLELLSHVEGAIKRTNAVYWRSGDSL